MSLHKLTAGSGYDYLTRQVAALDATDKGAGDLVHRYGPDIPIQRADTFRDLEAARARIIHALYLSAHAVGVSLHQHGHNL